MNTVKFATKYFKIVPTRNPEYFTLRAVDLPECFCYRACISQELASRIKVYSADELSFTFATGKSSDGDYKTYLNKVEYQGGIIYDGYAERDKK